jgi:hypothetical protein
VPHKTASRWIGLAASLTLAAIVAPPGVHGQGGTPPPSPAAGGAQGRGGRGGVAFGPPTTQTRYDDYTGFTKIFDGQTFTNWNGERDVWSIVDGMLHADTTKTPGQHHIHYTGPGAVMRDFTLKVEVKLSAAGANGGIQYRSRLLHPAHGGSIADPLGKPLPANITTLAEAVAAGITAAPAPRGGGPGGGGGARGGNPPGGGNTPPGGGAVPGAPGAAAEATPNPCVGEVGNRSATSSTGRGNAGATATGNPWQVSGYQFDMDSSNQYTGQLYEGQGRNIITVPGTIGMLLPGNCKILLGKLPGDAKAAIKPHQGLEGEWQQIEIIVRGNTMIHMINGQVMSVTVDDDPVARAPQGMLSLQLEGSGQIWYRNVYLKPQDKSLDFPR